MIDSLIKYLSNRPIEPILRESKEKDDLMALKLMSIIDYSIEKKSLYGKMQDQPKLKKQLMQLHSYGKFKYYDIQVYGAIGEPYAYILTHMAIVHNSHISTKTCAYCNRKDIIAHSLDKSLQMCYDEYLKKYDIQPATINTEVIVEFFELIKKNRKRARSNRFSKWFVHWYWLSSHWVNWKTDLQFPKNMHRLLAKE